MQAPDDVKTRGLYADAGSIILRLRTLRHEIITIVRAGLWAADDVAKAAEAEGKAHVQQAAEAEVPATTTTTRGASSAIASPRMADTNAHGANDAPPAVEEAPRAEEPVVVNPEVIVKVEAVQADPVQTDASADAASEQSLEDEFSLESFGVREKAGIAIVLAASGGTTVKKCTTQLLTALAASDTTEWDQVAAPIFGDDMESDCNLSLRNTLWEAGSSSAEAQSHFEPSFGTAQFTREVVLYGEGKSCTGHVIVLPHKERSPESGSGVIDLTAMITEEYDVSYEDEDASEVQEGQYTLVKPNRALGAAGQVCDWDYKYIVAEVTLVKEPTAEHKVAVLHHMKAGQVYKSKVDNTSTGHDTRFRHSPRRCKFEKEEELDDGHLVFYGLIRMVGKKINVLCRGTKGGARDSAGMVSRFSAHGKLFSMELSKFLEKMEGVSEGMPSFADVADNELGEKLREAESDWKEAREAYLKNTFSESVQIWAMQQYSVAEEMEKNKKRREQEVKDKLRRVREEKEAKKLEKEKQAAEQKKKKAAPKRGASASPPNANGNGKRTRSDATGTGRSVSAPTMPPGTPSSNATGRSSAPTPVSAEPQQHASVDHALANATTNTNQLEQFQQQSQLHLNATMAFVLSQQEASRAHELAMKAADLELQKEHNQTRMHESTQQSASVTALANAFGQDSHAQDNYRRFFEEAQQQQQQQQQRQEALLAPAAATVRALTAPAIQPALTAPGTGGGGGQEEQKQVSMTASELAEWQAFQTYQREAQRKSEGA